MKRKLDSKARWPILWILDKLLKLSRSSFVICKMGLILKSVWVWVKRKYSMWRSFVNSKVVTENWKMLSDISLHVLVLAALFPHLEKGDTNSAVLQGLPEDEPRCSVGAGSQRTCNPSICSSLLVVQSMVIRKIGSLASKRFHYIHPGDCHLWRGSKNQNSLRSPVQSSNSQADL